MSVLDQVIALKNRGASDKDVVSNLREQGVSPKAISDALSQAKIKDAVQGSESAVEEGMMPSVLGPEKAEELPTEGSISDEDLMPPPRLSPSMQSMNYVPLHQEADEEHLYVPQPGDYNQQNQSQQQYPVSQQQYQQPQEEYQQQEYAPQENYDYQSQGMQPGISMAGSSADTDTVIEISEQVFADKVRGIIKQLETLNEFRTLSETKIENLSERLRRIELSIDKLQTAILEKIGSYGRGLDNMKKEVEMVQDSFRKIVNVAAEKSDEALIERRQKTPSSTTQVAPVQKIEKKTIVLHKSQSPKTRSKKK